MSLARFVRSLGSRTGTHGGVSHGFVRFFSVGPPRSPRGCSHAREASKVLGCRQHYSWGSHSFHHATFQVLHERSSAVEKSVDPFSLVADELSLVANRLRSMVVAEVPKLALAAEYFFKMGVEGKRFRPTVRMLVYGSKFAYFRLGFVIDGNSVEHALV